MYGPFRLRMKIPEKSYFPDSLNTKEWNEYSVLSQPLPTLYPTSGKSNTTLILVIAVAIVQMFVPSLGSPQVRPDCRNNIPQEAGKSWGIHTLERRTLRLKLY